MGYDCTLHLVDEDAIREQFVPRLLGSSTEPTALDRVHPGAEDLWRRVRELLLGADARAAAEAVSVAAVMFSASMLPYRYERGLALSLAFEEGRVFPDSVFVPKAEYAPDGLFTEVVAAHPQLHRQFSSAWFSGNYSTGLYVPADHVADVLDWVQEQLVPLSKGERRKYRGIVATLRAAADRKLGYWEATDLAVPAAGEFPGDPELMWAQYLGNDGTPAAAVETAPASPIASVLDDIVDGFLLSHSDGKNPRVELWDLAVWPPRLSLQRNEFWVAAARTPTGGWLAMSTHDTKARPRVFGPILVDGADDAPKLLPAKGPGEADLNAHECYVLGARPVVLHEVKRHLLRFGGLNVGDPLPGPLWLAESGAWEQIPGIPAAAVVKSVLGDAALPMTGGARLADGSTVLIWDGNGYELDATGTGCVRSFEMGAERSHVAFTSVPAGDDGFFYLSNRDLYEIHRGGTPIRHVEAWTNVMAVRPGPDGGLLLKFGENDEGDVGVLYFPEDGTYISLPPEMFDDRSSYSALYWSEAADRIVVVRGGFVAVAVESVLAQPRSAVPE
ncbi:hypothetical protein [Nocardia suismassiliense]|uniref:hypothetical protein n=1 Tax=Nocardia suismassiliense TaxID=2077092 RepID=UPI000D1F8068|nr:hypothetical protein [Nocardia suismassiliense]